MKFKNIFIIVLLSSSVVTYGQNKINENLFYFKDTLKDFSNNTLFSGSYTAFFPGQIKFKGSFINGLKHGEFTYYQDPMKANFKHRIDSIVNYENGQLNGLKFVYFENNFHDVLQEKLNYKNGKLDGTCYYWNNSFQLEKIVNYKDGKVLNENNFETDTTISFIRVIIKEFPNDTVELKNLSDSLTLEIVGAVIDYRNDRYSCTYKTMKNFTIKSFEVTRGMKYQKYKLNRMSSNVFKFKNMCSTDNVFIVNLILIDRNNVEYELPTTEFIVK